MIGKKVDVTTTFSGSMELPKYKEIEVADNEDLATPFTKHVPREPYIVDSKLKDAVNLAIALGRPLLVQGDPGCGKTRLAYAISYELESPLEIAYIKSTSRAQDLLYTYDAVRRLYDAQLGTDGPIDNRGEPLARYARNYIKLGPLGRAIARSALGRRSVVLIDEIDKADLDFPNDLLWELDRLEFQVEESKDMHYSAHDDPSLRPIIIVTHNEEKALPNAFLRRCIFHYIEFPNSERTIFEVLSLHDIQDSDLKQKAIEVLQNLRQLDLRKKPGLSELLDWVRFLEAYKVTIDKSEDLPFAGALLKQPEDLSKSTRGLKREQ